MSAISATPPMHNTTGMRRQIRHACAGQTMKIETVPGPLCWQGEARSFYSGPLAACRLYVRHRPLLAQSNLVTSPISLQSTGSRQGGGDMQGSLFSKHHPTNKHEQHNPMPVLAVFACAVCVAGRARCVLRFFWQPHCRAMAAQVVLRACPHLHTRTPIQTKNILLSLRAESRDCLG